MKIRKISPVPSREFHDLIMEASIALCDASDGYSHMHVLGSLWDYKNKRFKTPESLKREFKTRWFLWRSLLPISMVAGVSGMKILRGRPYFTERSLSIWMAIEAGGVSMNSIGEIVDRDHTSIMNAYRRANEEMENNSSPTFLLMKDVLEIESRCLSRR